LNKPEMQITTPYWKIKVVTNHYSDQSSGLVMAPHFLPPFTLESKK